MDDYRLQTCFIFLKMVQEKLNRMLKLEHMTRSELNLRFFAILVNVMKVDMLCLQLRFVYTHAHLLRLITRQKLSTNKFDWCK